ncbi:MULTISPECIES: DUF4013 domain-containing protein [unclassified Methanoregula]|uniref:DUF4013 domain-containing protein n=1 Tax=unclassified Methanoregula TaxID=2649730 RepID=UPI0009CF4CFF|nr:MULTISPECIES: DUF4013 domain-containing protein [unclassified Methanoregula]OPX63799.1 MAG: hypothetical protein A4E33_01499 [Methanoregula sp. PtaB.Bin085]OPY36660.1 MAG: hypothetical protein A4E34_00185 [Methanoregula sp. PtaU1.Bin006]
MDLGDIPGNAFQYTYSGLTGKPATWLILIILSQLCYIPLIGFVIVMILAGVRGDTLMAQLPLIAAGLAVMFLLILLLSSFYEGFMVHVMNKDPELPAFPDPWLLFGSGIRYTVIYFLYFLIPMLLVLATIAAAVLPLVNGPSTNTTATQMEMMLTMLGGFALAFLSAVILSLFWIIGIVRFARTGSVSEAFNFSGILSTIGRIGWGFYIMALLILAILLIVFNVVVFVIQTILGIIPLIGVVFTLIMLLIQVILGPFIAIFIHRYFSILYDCAEPA